MTLLRVQCLALAFLCTLVPSTLSAQEIQGTVTLTDRAKKRASSRYKRRTAQLAASDKPRAIVYLEGANISAQSTNDTAILAQKNYQFSPKLLPIQLGTRVSFPNNDDEYHNVLSYSKIKSFDLGRYRKGEKAPEITFDTPGVVNVFCEIHEHMRAKILVLDTPYFTTTDENGAYSIDIKDLPSGEYTVTAWKSKKIMTSKPIKIVKGSSATLHFE